MHLIEDVMGDFAPEALASWTVNVLPERLRLWVRTYGNRVVLGSYPGSKLHLLLQQELERHGVEGKRCAKRADACAPASAGNTPVCK